ncbi:unnamed protein product [Choristocarpus tenellus]
MMVGLWTMILCGTGALKSRPSAPLVSGSALTRKGFIHAVLASSTLPLVSARATEDAPLFSRRRSRTIDVEGAMSPGSSALELQVILPQGAYFTRGATSRWRAVGGQGSTIATGVLQEVASQTGRSVISTTGWNLGESLGVEVESAVFYCLPTEEGSIGNETMACRMDAVVFSIPVAMRNEGSEKISLLQQVSPPQRKRLSSAS